MVEYLLHVLIFYRIRPSPPDHETNQKIEIRLCDQICEVVGVDCWAIEKPLGKISFKENYCSREIKPTYHGESDQICFQVCITEIIFHYAQKSYNFFIEEFKFRRKLLKLTRLG